MRLCATLLGMACLLACGAPQVRAALDEDFRPLEDPAFPPAAELLSGVLDSFPGVPVRVEAQLLSKTRAGELQRRINAVMWLNWGAGEPEARYTIEDAFGRPLEDLYIRRRADGGRVVHYRKGDPLEEASVPDLNERIQETDISWTDLSLDYLWWPRGKTVGAERIRGRFCYVVDVPASEEDAGEYAGVRLWVDPEIGILLQAAAYDTSGQMVKLLEVRSFKKVRDVWIIQNIDVQSYPARHKTSLRVKKAEAADQVPE